MHGHATVRHPMVHGAGRLFFVGLEGLKVSPQSCKVLEVPTGLQAKQAEQKVECSSFSLTVALGLESKR